MPPAALLIISVCVTLAAALAERMASQRHRRRMRALASEWEMKFSPQDQFRLTPIIYHSFPVAGAAKIRVVDLIYGIEHDAYRYIFTAEYTTGVVSGKCRIRRAATFTQPRNRCASAAQPVITLAPKHLPLLDQYRKLQAGGR